MEAYNGTKLFECFKIRRKSHVRNANKLNNVDEPYRMAKELLEGMATQRQLLNQGKAILKICGLESIGWHLFGNAIEETFGIERKQQIEALA